MARNIASRIGRGGGGGAGCPPGGGAGPGGGGPIMPQRVPGVAGGMIDVAGRGGLPGRGVTPLSGGMAGPRGAGRMQQQQMLAQQMRRGANPGGPNPTGNRMQMRSGYGGRGGGMRGGYGDRGMI